jgi:hypothetical protein
LGEFETGALKAETLKLGRRGLFVVRCRFGVSISASQFFRFSAFAFAAAFPLPLAQLGID